MLCDAYQPLPDEITVAIVRGDVYEGECPVFRFTLQLMTIRSTLSKLPPLPRTKAKTYTSQIWKSTSPQTVSCQWTQFSSSHHEILNPANSSGANLTLAYGRRYGLIGRNGEFNLWRILT